MLTASLSAICFTIFLLGILAGCVNKGIEPGKTDSVTDNALIFLRDNHLIVQGINKFDGTSKVTLHEVVASVGYGSYSVGALEKSFIGGYKRISFNVSRKPISTGVMRPSDDQLFFELPSYLSNLDACYILVQNGRPVPFTNKMSRLLGGNPDSDYKIGLRPYAELLDFRKRQRQAQTSLERAEYTLSKINEQISFAKYNLENKHEFIGNQCQKQEPISPKRPDNLIEEKEAAVVARELYKQYLAEKFGCDAAVAVVKVTAENDTIMSRATELGSKVCLGNSITSLIFNKSIFPSEASKLLRRDASSILGDFFEIIFSDCAMKGDTGCAFYFLVIVGSRYPGQIKQFESKLLEPYRTWLYSVQQEKNRVESEYRQCQSDYHLVQNADQRISDANRNISSAREELQNVEQQNHLEGKNVFGPESLRCH